MELYTYRCPVCGFSYQVPDYWVSFAPEDEMEFPHSRFDNGEPCECAMLSLQKEG